MNNCSDIITLPVGTEHLTEWTKLSEASVIALPTLWVADVFKARHLAQLFNLSEYSQAACEIGAGEHYILFDSGTTEAVVKGIAWRIRAAGGNCYLHRINNFLENLVSDAATARELTIQIIEFAQDYEKWRTQQDEQPLTTRIASEVAKVAIALLSGSERSIELGMLGERCKQSSYTWSKLVGNLEQEFKLELERRRGENKTERLKMELQLLLKESDPITRIFKRNEICSKFSLPGRDVDNLLNAVEAANNTAQCRRLSAQEFLEMEPEGLSWLIPGLLPTKGVAVVGGPPGSGKSTLAYDAAASVLFGDDFLGETPTLTGKVLFVAADELPCFVQDKFVNRGIFGSKNWDILLDWDISKMNALEQAIEDLRPALVVFDSFAAIHKNESFDENSAQARRSVEQLEALVNRYSAAGLLIHHTSKSKEQSGVGKLRGSSAIAAAASIVWLLEGEKNSEVRTFTTPKIRGAAPVNWRISLDSQNGHWDIINGNEEELANKTLGDRILEFMFTRPEDRFTAEEIINAVGYGKQSVYKTLDRLIQRGLLIKRLDKIDTRRKVYGLVKGATPPPHQPETKMSTKNSELIAVQELEGSRQLSNISNEQILGQLLAEQDELLIQQQVQEIVDTPLSTEGGGVKSSPVLGSNNNSVSCEDNQLSPGDEVEYIGAERKSLHGKKLVVSEIKGDVFWLAQAGYKCAVVSATSAELRRR